MNANNVDILQLLHAHYIAIASVTSSFFWNTRYSR